MRRSLSRRRFIQGFAGSALALGAARGIVRAYGGEPPASVLTGPVVDLQIGELAVNFTGVPRTATVVNGQLPGPLLRLREGDDVTLRVTNRLARTTSIHWHGLLLPAGMDGVPGISFPGIAPGATFTYRFALRQSGTYWYHAHSRFQEQTGLAGALLIEPRDGERHASDREHVLLLGDWTDIDPERLYATLKRHSGSFNRQRRTLGDLFADARRDGWERTLAERRMWAAMRMDPTDLLDVNGSVYTYLLNGRTPADNWTGLFAPGERVRLRIVNGSSMSYFDLRIPDLQMTVVAADGQDIEPVTVDELRIGAAEVYDVIVTPSAGRAYTVFAQAMDGSGYARGTLAPVAGMSAPVPPLDPRPLLAMADMGMAHGQDSGDAGAAMDMSHMDHSGMTPAQMAQMQQPLVPTHRASERSPLVDMQASRVRSRLDDPGVGLRDNGRRVLTYADLHTLDGPRDPRAAQRTLELHLTGHMERFAWSFDGQKFSESEPLHFAYGERLRIVLVNDTMMTHPIHLHGMWSELLDADDAFQVRKHTVTVQPAQRVSYLVTADAPGRWAYHCHLLYHMEAGMFREVVVGEPGS